MPVRVPTAALVIAFCVGSASSARAQHGHGSEGVGTAHMETSCLPAVQAKFDRALALLHNFWYARALSAFEEVQQADPACAMAYWGAAMTYNHPFWDAPTPADLQARHVRGRTIFALPDRILYGYFDTLARFIVESESWDDVPTLPLVAASSDFVVMKLHLEVMAAAHRKDAATAKAKAVEMMTRASVPGQHPFVQQILMMQAREAAAAAAFAAGDRSAAVKEMEAAIAIEDAIDSLSQPPYPIVPAHELYGSMLMTMGQPADARKHFEETLRRTPGRPKAIAGVARAAEAMGDAATARAYYTRLIEMWSHADPDRPELEAARRFLQPASSQGR